MSGEDKVDGWTRTKPTATGFYWVRGWIFAEPMIVTLWMWGGRMRVLFDRAHKSAAILNEWGFDGEWYGPLEVPK